jgi:hypothetical protein
MTGGSRRALALAGLATAVAAGGCGGCRRQRFPSRGDAASVVVLAPRAADDPGGPLADEGEPNNTVATARLLAFGGDPLVAGVAGTLPGGGKAADVDLFKVVVPGLGLDAGAGDTAAPGDALSARRLVVEVKPEEGIAPVLQLLDAAGRPVITSSSPAGERDGLPNVAVAPGGTYFLKLRAERAAPRGGPDAGAARLGYRMVVRVVDFELGDEREPNDRAPQATELGGAQTNPEVAGFFGWRKDEDWYRLPVEGLPPGSVLDLELDAVEGVTGALAVHDAAGVRLTGAQGRKGERLALRNVGVPAGGPAAPAAGGRDGGGAAGRSVYVVVRSDGGRSLDRRYILHVRAELAREGSETEPNDDGSHASPLADGLSSGFLPPGDTDVFRYAPGVPTALDLEVTPPDRVNVKIEVVRESDLQPLATADGAGRRQVERLTGVAIDDPVFVRLTQRKGDGNADEPYQLRVTPRPATAGAPGGGAPP